MQYFLHRRKKEEFRRKMNSNQSVIFLEQKRSQVVVELSKSAVIVK